MREVFKPSLFSPNRAKKEITMNQELKEIYQSLQNTFFDVNNVNRHYYILLEDGRAIPSYLNGFVDTILHLNNLANNVLNTTYGEQLSLFISRMNIIANGVGAKVNSMGGGSNLPKKTHIEIERSIINEIILVLFDYFQLIEKRECQTLYKNPIYINLIEDVGNPLYEFLILIKNKVKAYHEDNNEIYIIKPQTEHWLTPQTNLQPNHQPNPYNNGAPLDPRACQREIVDLPLTIKDRYTTPNPNQQFFNADKRL